MVQSHQEGTEAGGSLQVQDQPRLHNDAWLGKKKFRGWSRAGESSAGGGTCTKLATFRVSFKMGTEDVAVHASNPSTSNEVLAIFLEVGLRGNYKIQW